LTLYPTFAAAADSLLARSLRPIADGADKTEGVRIGHDVADLIIERRRTDGANATPARYVVGTAPGDWEPTPPNFPQQPQFTHWGRVTPFALDHADQFRPGPPPALASDRYGDAIAEVKALGIANSTAATADQALTGRFWNGAIQNYWNEIAQTATVAHHLTTGESARLFAQLDLAIADGVIAFYDAKYVYNFWRPVTAIREHNEARNGDASQDGTWAPAVGKTTPDPSYPGAHAVVSAIGASVLRSFFDTDQFAFDVTSEVVPGVRRSFTSFSVAAREATLSRIFAGVHFRFDLTAGERLGRRVADVVTDRLH
jgi:PAP2 superfamily protein